ncbi:hypothetical protein Cgig2_010606 [Carnegiea gigantea]|uniref:Pectin acetylesterase n=1 Tax=Carnegiea gigantea TaxID=171969 RepID=A0A9Q1KTP1_9CARY|nr:hypothetical protein Cgig2_010606 [Carnegiea gigantea]
MNKEEVFSGILSNNQSLNPDFYNWNRVKLRYCDGASFAGNSKFGNEALLSGCSAGGLATFLHCDSFTKFLPGNATVKCLSDAGFFLDVTDIELSYSMRSFYYDLISLQIDKPPRVEIRELIVMLTFTGSRAESRQTLHQLSAISPASIIMQTA